MTHHVSVIVIQAGAGLTALDRRPEQARSALEAIDRTAARRCIDMRRMLGILGDGHSRRRTRATAADADARPRAPRRAHRGGPRGRAPGRAVVDGERRPLDAGIELSAYRIVQEALTNALKHARGARARVACATSRGPSRSR